jgi:hypothetical protein
VSSKSLAGLGAQDATACSCLAPTFAKTYDLSAKYEPRHHAIEHLRAAAGFGQIRRADLDIELGMIPR